MKYFITGATGFIGAAVARRLREAGHDVVALVRDPARATDLAAVGVTLARGDVTDRESMRAPMAGVRTPAMQTAFCVASIAMLVIVAPHAGAFQERATAIGNGLQQIAEKRGVHPVSTAHPDRRRDADSPIYPDTVLF